MNSNDSKYVISYIDSNKDEYYLVSSGGQVYTTKISDATEFDYLSAVALQNYTTRVKKTEAFMSRVEKIYHKVT